MKQKATVMSVFFQKIESDECSWREGTACETHGISDSHWCLAAFSSAAEAKICLCLKSKVGPEWEEKKDVTRPKATQPPLVGSLPPVPLCALTPVLRKGERWMGLRYYWIHISVQCDFLLTSYKSAGYNPDTSEITCELNSRTGPEGLDIM